MPSARLYEYGDDGTRHEIEIEKKSEADFQAALKQHDYDFPDLFLQAVASYAGGRTVGILKPWPEDLAAWHKPGMRPRGEKVEGWTLRLAVIEQQLDAFENLLGEMMKDDPDAPPTQLVCDDDRKPEDCPDLPCC